MLGKEPEADEQMRFAATHRLIQMKDRLRGYAGEPRDTLRDEVLHALGDVRFLEEGGAVALGVDQFVELLDLVAELDRQRVGLERAGVADGFHVAFSQFDRGCCTAAAEGRAAMR